MKLNHLFFLVALFLSLPLCLIAWEKPLAGDPKTRAVAAGQSGYTNPFKRSPANDPAIVMKNDQAHAADNLLFIENKGQITDLDNRARPDIQFSLAASGGLNVFIGNAAIHYQFSRVDYPENQNVRDYKHPADKPSEPINYTMYRMDVTLVGADKRAEIITEDKQDYYENYYTPGTGENGAKALAYKKITYKEVYPHIDWVLYTRGGQLKHEFIVRKGGKVSDIQLKYGGATGLSINSDGSLTAKTPLGIITEEAPVTTQTDGTVVSSSFRLTGDILSYQTTGYEGDLLIDPGLLWATYYGGGSEIGYSVTTDGMFNVYLGGETNSASGIASSGGYQTTYSGGVRDAFLVKFDVSGMRQWATYYGGIGTDRGWSVATDGSGNIYLGGATGSPSGISSPGASQVAFGGGDDAFLVKFDASGIRQWATYYGGPGRDFGYSIITDGIGNVYLAGMTTSIAGISTPGACQAVFGGGGLAGDAFIVKFDGSGARQWATYYGGAGDDFAFSVATDNSANVYIAGQTNSTSGVASSGAFQTAFGGGPGKGDAFLAKFDGSGIRQWATYYGGPAEDGAISVATDRFANVYIGGESQSTSGIASPGGYQTTYTGTNDDFLVKFNSLGTRQWATYYGGSGGENGGYVATDDSANVYIAGFTYSLTGLATSGAWQTISGGLADAFLVKFDRSGVRRWATYYGGAGADDGYSVATDHSGSNVYISGFTTSSSGIATTGAYQTTYGGIREAFLAKFDCSDPITGTLGLCQGATTSLSSATAGGVWTSGNTAVAVVGAGSGVVSGIAPGTSVISYTLSGTTVTVTINPLPVAGTIAGASSVCTGSTLTLSATSVGTGVWSSAGSAGFVTVGSSTGIVTGVAVGTARISYSVTNSCGTALATKTISIGTGPSAGTITGPSSVCIGHSITLTDAVPIASGTGAWGHSNTTTSISGGIVTGAAAGTDTIKYTITSACGTTTAYKTITVIPLADAGTISGPQSLCVGNTITLIDTVPIAIGSGTWSSGSPGIATVSGAVVSGIASGIATISYTVTNSCNSASAIYAVTVNPLPPTGTITGSPAVCIGGTITLSDESPGGTWSGSPGITVAAGSITGTAAGPATITFTPASAFGCLAFTTFTLSVLPAPVFTINGIVSPVLCKGNANGSIAVSLSGGTPPWQYAWPGGNTTPLADQLAPGAYTVEVKELTTQCVLDKTFTITEPDSLSTTADIIKDYCSQKNGTITLATTGGTTPYAYQWSNNSTAGSISGLKAATYSVTVTDANGCTQTMAMQVPEVPCQDIIVHDVITPNGDGVNDTWIIEGLQHYPQNTVQIFDKLGDILYEQNIYNNDWNGRASTGTQLPDGTYYYLIKLNAPNTTGGDNIIKGALLIKR